MGMTPGEKKAYAKGFAAGEDSVEEGLPGWFGTFADMMTLLFAFFVLLAALSLNQKQFGDRQINIKSQEFVL